MLLLSHTPPVHWLQVLAAMDVAEKEAKPALTHMFSDVYSGPGLLWHLQEQMDDTMSLLKEHPELRPKGMPDS